MGYGLTASRGGLCRAITRLGGKLQPTYEALLVAVRQSRVAWMRSAPQLVDFGGKQIASLFQPEYTVIVAVGNVDVARRMYVHTVRQVELSLQWIVGNELSITKVGWNIIPASRRRAGARGCWGSRAWTGGNWGRHPTSGGRER